MAKSPVSSKGQQKGTQSVMDLTPFEKALESMGVGKETDGATTGELIEALGVSRAKVTALLKEAHAQGRLVRSRRVDNDHYSGRAFTFTVYRLKES